MAFDNAGNIVNAAAVELGLLPFSGKLADPFSSADPNIGKLCQYMQSLGRDLRRSRQWNHLRQTYTFTTATSQSGGVYPLPPDFGRFIDQTAWNRTNNLPVGGPLSPQQFQALKARLVGVVFTVLFETLRGNFQAFPDTGTLGNYVIAYEYVSSWWVTPLAQPSAAQWLTLSSYAANAYAFNSGNLYQTAAGGTAGATPPTHAAGTVSDGGVSWTFVAIYQHTTYGAWTNATTYVGDTYVTNAGSIYRTALGGTSGGYGPIGTRGIGAIPDGSILWTWVSFSGQDYPARSDDIILFDPELMQTGLQYLYKYKNGWPCDAEQELFQSTLAKVADDDTVASVLTMGGAGMGEPLIGQQSIPSTGFGQ